MREFKHHLQYWLRIAALSLLIAVLILKAKENRLERKIDRLKLIQEVPVVVDPIETNINTLK